MKNKLPQTGIDTLLKDESLLQSLSQKRVALLTNQSSLTKDFVPSAYALAERLGPALTCILTPEHGWGASIAEGEKVKDDFNHTIGKPIYSLYGGDKTQLEHVLSQIDCLIIDLQDVGLRCYTYSATCAKLLEKLSYHEIIVCDRPNPLGHKQQGPKLDPTYRSILAYLDVSFQHGQTLGELLTKYNQGFDRPLTLDVISGETTYQPDKHSWIPPSPNLPSWESVLLYPALVLLEGCNVSEGRGTGLPFTCIGAPQMNSNALVDFLNEIPGIRARPLSFTPQSGKLAGQECHGAHIILTDPLRLDAYSLGIKLIHFLKQNYPQFTWTEMERHKDKYFIDFLLGTSKIREDIDKGIAPSEVLERFG